MSGTAVDVQLAGSGIGLAGSAVSTVAAAEAATNAGAGATILGVSGITVGVGLATLGIGAGLAVLIMELFKGANPLQVPAAKAEQIYEAAADNMLSLEKAGIITEAQAVAGMQALITAGQNEESSLQSQIGNPAVKGSQNLTNVINAEITDAENVSPLPALLTGVTLQEAEAHYYITVGTPGWYPESETDAVAVTDQLATQFIAQNQPTVTAASAASAASSPASQSAAIAAAGKAAQTTGTNTTTVTAASFFSTSTGHLILLAALGFILWKVV